MWYNRSRVVAFGPLPCHFPHPYYLLPVMVALPWRFFHFTTSTWWAFCSSRNAVCGRLPKRYENSGQFTVGQYLTSEIDPPTQSKHFFLIACKGYKGSSCFISIIGSGIFPLFLNYGACSPCLERLSPLANGIHHAGDFLQSISLLQGFFFLLFFPVIFVHRPKIPFE